MGGDGCSSCHRGGCHDRSGRARSRRNRLGRLGCKLDGLSHGDRLLRCGLARRCLARCCLARCCLARCCLARCCLARCGLARCGLARRARVGRRSRVACGSRLGRSRLVGDGRDDRRARRGLCDQRHRRCRRCGQRVRSSRQRRAAPHGRRRRRGSLWRLALAVRLRQRLGCAVGRRIGERRAWNRPTRPDRRRRRLASKRRLEGRRGRDHVVFAAQPRLQRVVRRSRVVWRIVDREFVGPRVENRRATLLARRSHRSKLHARRGGDGRASCRDGRQRRSDGRRAREHVLRSTRRCPGRWRRSSRRLHRGRSLRRRGARATRSDRSPDRRRWRGDDGGLRCRGLRCGGRRWGSRDDSWLRDWHRSAEGSARGARLERRSSTARRRRRGRFGGPASGERRTFRHRSGSLFRRFEHDRSVLLLSDRRRRRGERGLAHEGGTDRGGPRRHRARERVGVGARVGRLWIGRRSEGHGGRRGGNDRRRRRRRLG